LDTTAMASVRNIKVRNIQQPITYIIALTFNSHAFQADV